MACTCTSCGKRIEKDGYCWVCSECYGVYCTDCGYIGGIDADTNSCDCPNCKEPMVYTTCQS